MYVCLALVAAAGKEGKKMRKKKEEKKKMRYRKRDRREATGICLEGSSTVVTG